MPQYIILVHDEAAFREPTAEALRSAGYEVTAIADSTEAINAFDSSGPLDLLITRANFPVGKINGIALARMALNKRPGLRVLFTARPEVEVHTAGLGSFMAAPIVTAELVALVGRVLQEALG